MEKDVPVFVVGSGMAARAMLSALALVKDSVPGLRLAPPHRLGRGEALPRVQGPSLLLIANPHAFHAGLVGEADRQGFTHVVCEKPVVVALEQIPVLKDIRAFVAVCHGYRQNWGPRRMRQAIAAGELGRLISVEGRYWQSSAAAHAVAGLAPRAAWKNDPHLSGPHDTLLDLGTHWADLVGFLLDAAPERARGWLSYVNAEAPHRDTHVHLEMDFPGQVRSWGSVSKTLHGMGNHLEVLALGAAGCLRWNFERPDELVLARGKETRIFFRGSEEALASKLASHHALGWLEGYVSIFESVLLHLAGRPAPSVPTLAQSIAVAETLLKMELTRQV